MSASLPASSSVSPWSSTTSCSRNPPGFPDSPRLSTQEMFLQGHMNVDRSGKMSSGRTYKWLRIYLRWSDLLMQDHTFLRQSTISKAWLSVYHLLITILMNLSAAMTSAWYFKEPLGNETKNFLISIPCFPWLAYTLTPWNPIHYYLNSSNLPSTTKTTKKNSAETKTTENLRMYSVIWQSTVGHSSALVSEHKSSFMIRDNTGDWTSCELLTLLFSI